MRVVVLGCGSWGTALAILLARNGQDVTLLGRNPEEISSLRETHTNPRYLPGHEVPSSVRMGSLDDVPSASDMAVLAVPSGAVREISHKIQGQHRLIVIASKGLEADSALRMTEVVGHVLPNADFGVLSGPNLAVEIAKGIPTVAVAAYRNRAAAEMVSDAFSCRSFRVSVTNDVIGVELAGALKNVLAIGAGMSDGLGFGDNTKGAFLSRGLMEMAKLGQAMGARADTFLGPAGVGDLFATAASQLSRNYRIGRALGEGRTLSDAVAQLGQVAEGVPTSEAVNILARQFSVELPIFAAVEAVLKGFVEPRKAVALLMERVVRIDEFLGALE